MNIGEKIQYYAVKNGFTQYGLAKATGLSQPFIGKLFKGEKLPSLDSLQTICSALGITLAEFFSEDSQTDPDEARLLSAYRQLPEDKQKTVVTMVDALAKE